MRNLSIRKKINIVVTIVFLITIISLITFATISLRKVSINAAENEAMAQANGYAFKIATEKTILLNTSKTWQLDSSN